MADMTEAFEPKKGWQKPENWVSYGLLIALGVVGLNFINPIMEQINRLLENTVEAAIWLGVLGVIGFIATSQDLHKLV